MSDVLGVVENVNLVSVPLLVAGTFRVRPAKLNDWTIAGDQKLTRPGVVIRPYCAAWSGNVDGQGHFVASSDGVIGHAIQFDIDVEWKQNWKWSSPRMRHALPK